MDPHSGRLYTADEMKAKPVSETENFVYIEGPLESVRLVSNAVRDNTKQKRKASRKARRKGRN